MRSDWRREEFSHAVREVEIGRHRTLNKTESKYDDPQLCCIVANPGLGRADVEEVIRHRFSSDLCQRSASPLALRLPGGVLARRPLTPALQVRSIVTRVTM